MNNRETFKDGNWQYVKSLGNGEHLIYDYETNKLEVWFNNPNTASYGIYWNNTVLEFARTFENQNYPFKKKLNEFILENELPHGSGIDCKWQIEDKGKYFKCVNAYHCMNENGYYDGYADFTLIIPKKNPIDFKLHFNGKHSQYKNERYLLRDYLEDTFHYAISEMVEKLNQ